MNAVDTYREVLERAEQAVQERTFYAAYPEHPKAYAEDGMAKAMSWLNEQLGNPFSELLQTDEMGWKGDEASPYTQQLLNIGYPVFSPDQLVQKAKMAWKTWRYVPAEIKANILIESLDRVKTRFFDIAQATMHTSGQSFMMAFQASGPHAMDRALEAIAIGVQEMKRYPAEALWDKPMGKFNIKVKKTWTAVGRGIGLVIGCSTFPVWNSVPGLYASLIAGNPVIVKPHPGAILPIAIVVAELQKALHSNGIDPNLVQLAADTNSDPITKKLAEHKDVKIIDYTGGNSFGDYLEALPGKAVFTEKAGVNSVILDSVHDLDAVMQNLAFAACLYSGQMCTAPQNFFVPEQGIKVGDMEIGFEAVVQKFVEAVKGIALNPKMGPGTLGAIQNVNTLQRVVDAKTLPGQLALDSLDVTNEEFSRARMASPIVMTLEADQKDVFSHELFGPIVLFIKTNDTKHSVQLAKELAEKKGAISCGAYTIDTTTHRYIADEMAEAYTPVAFNLVGPIWMNQNAAFSDFHVTGGNPAGNATFTDSAYLVKRFVWVGHKEFVQ